MFGCQQKSTAGLESLSEVTPRGIFLGLPVARVPPP